MQNTEQNQQQNSLFVGGLDWSIKSEDLAEIFKEFGTVVSAQVITDRETGRSRGFGFVTMETADSAKSALDALNNATFNNRKVTVKYKESNGNRQGGGGNRSNNRYGSHNSW